MKLKLLGAVGGVTGSCYLLTSGSTQVLVDCGMFQGKKDEELLNSEMPMVDLRTLNAVLLTHAHLDHCGRLPLLTKNGYEGPFYMTKATERLAELVMLDAARIAQEDAELPLYIEDDVTRVTELVKIVDYDKTFEIGDFEVTFVDAGHILGSASIVIEEKSTGRKVVFSGDLGNSPEPLLSPTEWILKADFVIMEATYGDRIHGNREEIECLTEIINQAERIGGVVLIPSFSLQRAQDLLYIFDGLKKEGKMNKETPVFLDSPMAIKATNIFREFPELYSKKVRSQSKTDDPFDFPGLVICDTMEKSKQIRNVSGTKIIVAGSGMMTGGRIIHHAANYLDDPTTQIVFVGFQAEGTLGREIKEGNKEIMIWDRHIEVRAEIREIETMSAHADQGQLLYWLSKIKGISKVFLTHGEEVPKLVLKEKIKQDLTDVEVLLPYTNEEIEL